MVSYVYTYHGEVCTYYLHTEHIRGERRTSSCCCNAHSRNAAVDVQYNFHLIRSALLKIRHTVTLNHTTEKINQCYHSVLFIFSVCVIKKKAFKGFKGYFSGKKVPKSKKGF